MIMIALKGRQVSVWNLKLPSDPIESIGQDDGPQKG